MAVRLTIADAAHTLDIPAGTIRRWLADDRIVRHGDRKPYLVDLDEIIRLRDTLALRPSLRRKHP